MAGPSGKDKLSLAEMRQEKDRLEEELAETIEKMAEIENRLEERGDYSLGEGDPAIHTWEVNLALYQRMREKIESIRMALQSIADGTYGICRRCGKRIDRARLEIIPHAVLCVDCARQEGA